MYRSIIQLLKNNLYFFIPLIVFYCFGIYRIIFYSKVDTHLFFNQWVGNKFFDEFFKYATFLGDGWFVIAVGILWLFKNIRQGVMILISYALAGGFVSILKNYVFDEYRPSFAFNFFFKDKIVKYVDGVELLALNSFPSGHSTAAFALFSSLALFEKNQWIKFIYALMAIIVTFSRVYLSQHWLNDILAGSLIGLLVSFVVYSFFEKYQFLIHKDKGLMG
jgi:membrane-associated phospholipid phosphatase